MHYSSHPTAQPITLDRSTESKVYGLFAIAMGITVLGVYVGFLNAEKLLTTNIILPLFLVELVLIFSMRWWMNQSPLNVLLFGLFPFLSGITITPYLMSILYQYVNGASILLNALAATTFMSIAAAVFARTTTMNLSVLGRTLFFGLLGIIGLSILQFFVPAMQTTGFELLLSGAGVVLFAAFTAYDLQRIQALSGQGANAFMLALSLYLDIFNLFVMILRFMVALSGRD